MSPNEMNVSLPSHENKGDVPETAENRVKYIPLAKIDIPVDAPLTLGQKLAYGLGGPPMQLVTNCVSFFFTIFLLETAGVNPYYNSVIQFAARAWDALTDPMIGYLVTRTKSRWGQFRPWLIFSAPFGCLSFFLIFYVPDIKLESFKFLYYLFMVLAFQTAVTAFHVPYSSMTMVLTANAKDRDICSAMRMGFELCGLLLGVAMFGSITKLGRIQESCDKNVTINGTQKQFERQMYMAGSGTVCIIYLFCSLTVFFGSKERRIVVESKEKYFTSIKRIMTFTPYLRLMFAFLFCSLGLQIVQGNLALYVTHSLDISNHMLYGILTVLVVAVLTIPIAQFSAMKLGKKLTFALGLFIMMPVHWVIFFVGEQPPLAVFYSMMVISGLTISVAFLLPWSMLPDVIDEFTLEYGVRKEAAFYSFYVFFNKFAVGIALGISSIVLGLSGYKDGGQCVQQPKAVGDCLRWLMGPTSFVCFLISLFCLCIYPINENDRKRTQIDLQKRRDDLEDSDSSSKSSSEQERMNQSSATIVTEFNSAANLIDSHNSNCAILSVSPEMAEDIYPLVLECSNQYNINPNNTRV